MFPTRDPTLSSYVWLLCINYLLIRSLAVHNDAQTSHNKIDEDMLIGAKNLIDFTYFIDFSDKCISVDNSFSCQHKLVIYLYRTCR